ncbi:MAG TPA: Na+-dependent transporter [Xanthobacteraceae bacterium]|nr:Na+-dependent transporter [Xanthobacteraceae bacterium]
MSINERLRGGLHWLGRHGTRAIAVSLAVGILFPPLAAFLKPVFGASVFCLMVLAFLRVEPPALWAVFARPWLVLAASVWIMVVVPLVFCPLFQWLGVDASGREGLLTGLVLQAAAPPVLSATAFSAILGLDVAVSLATLIVTTAITPLTAPIFVALFAGAGLAIDPLVLALRLAAFLGGAFVIALLLRRWLGAERVAAHRHEIDGASVITLMIFGVASMDGVTAKAFADPHLVLVMLAIAFALALGLFALTTLIFRAGGLERAFAVGFAGGHRNMAIMLATAGTVPDIAWIYFATYQFPVYLAPLIVSPLISRLLVARLPRD